MSVLIVSALKLVQQSEIVLWPPENTLSTATAEAGDLEESGRQ